MKKSVFVTMLATMSLSFVLGACSNDSDVTGEEEVSLHKKGVVVAAGLNQDDESLINNEKVEQVENNKNGEDVKRLEETGVESGYFILDPALHKC